jgi:hypothetical protein
MADKRTSTNVRKGGYESGPALVSQLKPPPRTMGVGVRPPAPHNNPNGKETK